MSTQDVCPYPRPFQSGFTDCPAFQPTVFVPRTSREAPLVEGWTCSHLAVGEAAVGEFYPRCRVGDARAREAWAEEHASKREQLRELRYSFYSVLAPVLPDLLAAQRLVHEDGGHAFDALAADLSERADRWFDEHAAELRLLGISGEAGRGIVHDTIAVWRAQRDPINTAEPPAEAFERYPEVRRLLLPDLGASSP